MLFCIKFYYVRPAGFSKRNCLKANERREQHKCVVKRQQRLPMRALHSLIRNRLRFEEVKETGSRIIKDSRRSWGREGSSRKGSTQWRCVRQNKLKENVYASQSTSQPTCTSRNFLRTESSEKAGAVARRRVSMRQHSVSFRSLAFKQLRFEKLWETTWELQNASRGIISFFYVILVLSWV